MKSYSRIQAEINLDAICSNIEEIKRIVRPETAVMAVIKADGYGHGDRKSTRLNSSHP